MRIIGCDLHARQQTLAMLDTTTGEVVNQTLLHEGNQVREFYSQLPRPVLVVPRSPSAPPFGPDRLAQHLVSSEFFRLARQALTHRTCLPSTRTATLIS